MASMEVPNGAAQEKAAQPFPLIALPDGLLASYVWPHLDPYSQAQLRATCKQLRAVADGLLGPGLRVSITSQELEACTQLPGLCAMLARLPQLTELTLVATDFRTNTRGEILSAATVRAEPMAAWLRGLAEAAGGSRLRKLALCQDGSGSLTVNLALVQAIGTCFPQLTHLRLGPCTLDSRHERGSAALAVLPQTLTDLQLALVDPITMETDEDASDEDDAVIFDHSLGSGWHQEQVLAQLLPQAFKLPHMARLRLQLDGFSDANPSKAISAGMASDPPLQHLGLDGTGGKVFVGDLPLRPRLGSSLQSLTQPHNLFGEDIISMLAATPNLRNLRLGINLQRSPELHAAICGLQHLTSLRVGLTALLPPQGSGKAQAGAVQPLPAGLATLRLGLLHNREGDVAQVLRSVPVQCRVVFEDRLGRADAAAALAHPGGAASMLVTSDPLTCDRTELEVPLMVHASTAKEIGAAAATQPLRCLDLGDVYGGTNPMPALAACSSLLGQLHTLAIQHIGGSPRDLTALESALETLAQLCRDGKLPALRLFLMRMYAVGYPGQLEAWRPHLVTLLQAGCTVHVLPITWHAGHTAAWKALVQAMPQRHKLLLGVRRDAHDVDHVPLGHSR